MYLIIFDLVIIFVLLFADANTSAESLKDVQEEVDRLKRLQNSTKIALSQVKNNLEKICNGTSCPDLSVLSLTLDFSGVSIL